MTAANEPVGVSQVFLRPPIETLFKDRYFVIGSGIGGGTTKLYKDLALVILFNKDDYGH